MPNVYELYFMFFDYNYDGIEDTEGEECIFYVNSDAEVWEILHEYYELAREYADNEWSIKPWGELNELEYEACASVHGCGFTFGQGNLGGYCFR